MAFVLSVLSALSVVPSRPSRCRLYTFDDLRIQLKAIIRLESRVRAGNRMGSMGAMRELLEQPGALRELNRLIGMIDAMTPDERRHPAKAGEPNRCRRIATGSGATPSEVGQFVTQMLGLAEMMKRIQRP